eukprot:4329215-Pyramimonas_sp.AAC.1
MEEHIPVPDDPADHVPEGHPAPAGPPPKRQKNSTPEFELHRYCIEWYKCLRTGRIDKASHNLNVAKHHKPTRGQITKKLDAHGPASPPPAPDNDHASGPD